ncbi:MAG: hypothetical protein AAGC81_01805 [Pseudomonadota bacterium]
MPLPKFTWDVSLSTVSAFVIAIVSATLYITQMEARLVDRDAQIKELIMDVKVVGERERARLEGRINTNASAQNTQFEAIRRQQDQILTAVQRLERTLMERK